MKITKQAITGKMIGGMVLTWLMITTSGTGLAQTSINATGVQSLLKMSDVQLNSFLEALDATPQLSADAVPRFANFFSLAHPEWPPLPDNPNGASVWQMSGPNFFLLDDVNVRYNSHSHFMMQANDLSSPPGPGDFGTNDDYGDSDYSAPPDISNYAKYMAQSFSVIDTNNAAANDTNLYNACVAFGDDTNTVPVLQIAQYQPGCLLLKASHFDYSAETRDFCVVVCDKVETPLFKSIDIYAPSNNIQNGGWLVQGSVPAWQVTDPMYMVVSNISTVYNAFFRVIPYNGAQILLTGPNAYDVVSNTVALQATVTDLSGVTNESFEVTVDGNTTRYGIGTNNTINIRTDYNPNGICTIYANAANAVRIYDPSNPPDNAKIFFSGSAPLPVDFENDTYMAWAGNNSSPSIGTTYSIFVVDKAQNVEASISDPSDGHLVAYFSGYVSSPETIEIPWNFTEADGVTPYTNDSYVVTFTAFDPDTLVITNSIDRSGVRTAAANIMAYEEEDPAASGAPNPTFLNNQADTYVGGQAVGLYESLYESDWLTTTLYTTDQIGEYRDLPTPPTWPCVLTHGTEQSWANQVLLSLASTNYSDFTYYMGHGNGTDLGGGPKGSTFVTGYMPSLTFKQYVFASSTGPNHRMRKVALWACYTDSPDLTSMPGGYLSLSDAFGIRRTADQTSSWMMKNVGLFFGGALPQGGYSGVSGGTQVEVAVLFDDLWVSGPNPWPGACDPTYAFSWALSQIRGISPELDSDNTYPAMIGFPYLNFAGVYDGEFITNNVSHVKR